MTAEIAGPVTDVVAACAAPALILEVPSERIVAASPSAVELLSATGEDIIGRSLEDFAEDQPSGALPLLATGKLNGYEALRTMHLADGRTEPVRVWIRGLGNAQPPPFVLAVFYRHGYPAGVPAPAVNWDERLHPVIGTTDSALHIEQISVDLKALLGYQPDDVVGSSLFTLFDPEDGPSLLWALAQAASRYAGVSLWLRARRQSGGLVPCQMLVVSMVPEMTYAFALLPGEETLDPLIDSGDMRELVWRLCRGANAVAAGREAGGASERDPEILSQLTSRELEIVLMLLSGDRVPEIARALYLAQGTVRNHLSAVFKRLGVSSQQELISMLRTRSRLPR
jgi:DNA-binding CsgD family transcriptional regulator